MFFEQKLQFTEIKNYISRMPEAVPKWLNLATIFYIWQISEMLPYVLSKE